MTKYKLMVATDEPGVLRLIPGEFEAHGPQQAMRMGAKVIAENELERGLTMVAVPSSNWTEEPVAIRVPPPRLVIGGEQVTIEEAVAEVEAETTTEKEQGDGEA